MNKDSQPEGVKAIEEQARKDVERHFQVAERLLDMIINSSDQRHSASMPRDWMILAERQKELAGMTLSAVLGLRDLYPEQQPSLSSADKVLTDEEIDLVAQHVAGLEKGSDRWTERRNAAQSALLLFRDHLQKSQGGEHSSSPLGVNICGVPKNSESPRLAT